MGRALMGALRERYPLWVGGRAEQPDEDLEVTDKYSGAVATRVGLADAATVDRAIAAATSAVPAMRAFPGWKRRDVLRHCAARLRERAEELARVLCVEAGKPIRDARGEVARLVDTFDIAAEEATRLGGEVLDLALGARTDGTRGFTRRVPIGPVALVTPFNFPLNLVAHKVAPAIAAGCPFVLKPSERTPVSALLVGEVLAETELPGAAWSVVPALPSAARALVTDERLRLFSFTGGEVGWKLRAEAGRKKVLLELGGNAACVVDADQGPRLDHVAERLVLGAFYQSGQSCISVQRILVHASLHAPLREKLVAKARALVPGDPSDEATFLGPVIDAAAAERLEAWTKSAVARGASLLCGGGRRGTLLDATLLEGVPHDEPLWAEEAFGPVAVLEPFVDFDAALAAVNDSRFGLQAGVFTDDLGHALRAWDALDVGGVIVGDVPSFRVDSMPYGGVKSSGLGREGVRSAIEELTEVRLLVTRGV